MLATPILLLDAVFARLFEFHIPALMIHGPEDFSNFATATFMADLISLAITLILFATNPKVGKPFLLVACVIVMQILSFQFLGPTDWWTQMFIASTGLSVMGYVVIGLLVGSAIVWLGWSRPYSTTR